MANLRACRGFLDGCGQPARRSDEGHEGSFFVFNERIEVLGEKMGRLVALTLNDIMTNAMLGDPQPFCNTRWTDFVYL